MSEANIQYRDYVFQTAGRPQYGADSKFESNAPHGLPVRKVTTYTITQWFMESSFADNEARYAALLAALGTAEGTLFIEDENGTTLVDSIARVTTAGLPEQWGEHLKEVKVSFEVIETLASAADAFTAVFTPEGEDPITLAGVSKVREDIKVARYGIQIDDRSAATGTILIEGVVRANPQESRAARRTALLAQKATMQAVADCIRGGLEYGDFTKTVRVDEFTCDIADGTDELRWSLAASYMRLPEGDYAQCDYSVKTRDDLGANERFTTVSGRIMAATDVLAVAKRDALKAAYATGRMLLREDFNEALVSVADGDDSRQEWEFTMEFREILPDAVESYKLSVSDKTDYASGLITTTYSGIVTAASSAVALAKARVLGAGIYPMKRGATETVNSMSVQGAAAQFTEVSFSYEYERRGSERHAEVTVDSAKDRFGASTQTVSGYAVADTAGNALTFARSFKPSGVLILSEREGVATDYHGATPGTLYKRTTFSYVARTAPLEGTLDYKAETKFDYKANEQTLSFKGTCWAESEAAADALITALLDGVTGTLVTDTRTSAFKDDGTEYFESREFDLVVTTSIAGEDAVMEASYSLEDTYTFDHDVVTPIPFGEPHIQTGCGIVPGRRVATGSITALSLATAQAWARAKEPDGDAQTEQDAPREQVETIYYPMSDSSVKAYRLSFTYSRTMTDNPLPS